MDAAIPDCMGGRKAGEEQLGQDSKAAAIVASSSSTDPVMASYWEHGFKGR